jgi:hypothetical protein
LTIFPTGLTYLGFLLRENLLLYSSNLLLGFSNWAVIYIINTAPPTSFLALLPGKKNNSARGVLHAHPLLCFKFCFTLFLLASFYQKNKKISFLIIVIFTCLLLVLLEWLLLKTPSCVILLALIIVILSTLLLRHLLLLQIFMRLSLLY